MPAFLLLIIKGLAMAVDIYGEAKPIVDKIVALIRGEFPEHAARIEEIWPSVLPTEAEQPDLDAAVARVEAKLAKP